ncbi:hypothetical protein J3A83DRAFT_4185928 [Scleroderma citrinum]
MADKVAGAFNASVVYLAASSSVVPRYGKMYLSTVAGLRWRVFHRWILGRDKISVPYFFMRVHIVVLAKPEMQKEQHISSQWLCQGPIILYVILARTPPHTGHMKKRFVFKATASQPLIHLANFSLHHFAVLLRALRLAVQSPGKASPQSQTLIEEDKVVPLKIREGMATYHVIFHRVFVRSVIETKEPMLTETTSGMAVVSPTATASPSPPIAQVLPLLYLVIGFSYGALSLAIRVLLASLAPLQLLWPLTLYFLSPITITLSVITEAVIFIPFSLLHQTISVLYPLYVFFAIACLTGAAVGIFGRLIIFTTLGVFAHSTGLFQRRRSPTTSPASQPLRRRKRRSVRIQ